MKQRSLEEISHENWDGFIKGVEHMSFYYIVFPWLYIGVPQYFNEHDASPYGV
jgi:hypothetical protein